MSEIDVNSELYIPNSAENFLFNIFQNTKVSFVFLLIFVVIIYIGIFMLTGSGSGNVANDGAMSFSKNMTILVLEFLLWVFLIIVIYVNIVNHDTSNIDFQAKIENLFNTKIAELSVNAEGKTDNAEDETDNEDETNKCENDDDGDKEVFHIAENKFTFEEAKEMCSKYGARLANYDEIERAYNNGANWCNYGWSEDQMGFFPTQRSVYNELKSIPGHKNDCGRTGINGGYFDNPKIKLGVNCFGVKPVPKDTDKDYMHAINHSPAISEEEMKKNNDSKNEFTKYIIAPFNKEKWNA